MSISLDFDDTYTEDPELWNRFIANARNKNHTVLIITMRYPEEGTEVEASLNGRVDAIHYTGRKGKMQYCNDRNIKVDVWIDDSPYFIVDDALPIIGE